MIATTMYVYRCQIQTEWIRSLEQEFAQLQNNEHGELLDSLLERIENTEASCSNK